MKVLDSVVNLTDIIYPTEETVPKSSSSSSPSMAIRPPTPSMPETFPVANVKQMILL
ncbi:unnamed protein product [Absidia cylindrospora]